MLKKLVLTALLLALAGPAFAQQTTPAPAQPQTVAGATQLYELVLKDGSRIYGSIEREDDREVVFRTHSGAVLTAPRSDIVSLQLVKGRLENGQFVRADGHRSRLFFAPTGRSLEKGQVSVGVFQFLAPFVQVGITDRFSIGGGTPLFFGVFEEDFRPFWITPKFQIVKRDEVQVAVGVLQILNLDGDNGGIGYTVATFGNSDNAFTAGMGVAYGGDSKEGVIMIGGERRVRRNIKLISENYIFEENVLVSGGIRFLGERLSADLALVFPIGSDDGFIGFPVVNFVYIFK